MRFFLIFRLFVTAIFAATLLLGSAQPAHAQLLDWTTGDGEDVCVKQVTLTNNTDGTFKEDDPVKEIATLQGVGCLVRNVLAVATTFIGLAAFVMLIMGAFLYLTSGGQSKHIDAAKQAITYAVIGIVVALMAFFILNLVATFTGAKGILRFDIFVESSPGNPAPVEPDEEGVTWNNGNAFPTIIVRSADTAAFCFEGPSNGATSAVFSAKVIRSSAQTGAPAITTALSPQLTTNGDTSSWCASWSNSSAISGDIRAILYNNGVASDIAAAVTGTFDPPVASGTNLSMRIVINGPFSNTQKQELVAILSKAVSDGTYVTNVEYGLDGFPKQNTAYNYTFSY